MIKYIIIILLICTKLFASITDELTKLSDMYKEGLLTKEEFTKAKSILLEIEEINKKQIESQIEKKDITTESKESKKITKKTKTKKSSTKDVKVERIYDTVGSKFTDKNYEKMKLTVGDYLIYTHRPGAIKIKQISNNKQLVVIGDRLKIKYYNNGQDYIKVNLDEKNKKLNLYVNDINILTWKGQYVQEAEATFYQILAMGRTPFHYYIKLDVAGNAFALNISKFTRRIELAVDRVKIELAAKFNISLEDIENIIKENDMMAANKFIKTADDTEDLTKQKVVLLNDLKKTLGDDAYSKIEDNISTNVDTKLSKTINSEIKVAIDDSIRDAINSGLEAAALDAAIDAFLDALISGASWADAYDAAEQACAGQGGC